MANMVYLIFADLYYPMDSKVSNEVLGKPYNAELKNDAPAILPRLISEGMLQRAVNLSAGQWLDLGSHNDKCLGNLTLCPNGFSAAFWIWIDPSKFGPADEVFTLFTNAGYELESPGMWAIMDFCQNNLNGCWSYKVKCYLADKYWALDVCTTWFDDPEWILFAFTWHPVNGLRFHTYKGYGHYWSLDPVTSESFSAPAQSRDTHVMIGKLNDEDTHQQRSRHIMIDDVRIWEREVEQELIEEVFQNRAPTK